MADKPPKKDPSDKMKALVAAREEVRAQLTKALGKGARVGNAAAFLSKPPAERNLNAFVRKIKERDEAAAAAKAAAKTAAKEVKVVKKEAKSLAKTAKKNANAAKAAAAANAAAKSKGKTKKLKYFKFPYDSVEREAKKIAKKAEELQAKLETVDLKLIDICKLCKDLKENTPTKA